MAASLEEFVELLSSEQHVDIGRLRHLARHGIHPAVRGEVWMYLLGVLSADKSQEMTSVRALYNTYDALLSHFKVDPQVRASIQAEADRTWRTRVPAPSATATSGDASQSMPKTREGTVVAQQDVPVVARKKRSQLVPVAPMNLEPSGWPSTSRASGAASHPPSPGLPPSSSTSSSSSSSSSSLSSPSSSQAAAAAPPPLSAAQREHEERREAFIRRVTNIVGVYISKKAHDKCEAKRLRRRLADEQHRRQNSRKGGEEAIDHDSGSEGSDSTHRCARAERSAAPSSPLPQLSFDHATGGSSSSSRSPRRSFTGTSSEGSSQQSANGFGAEELEEDVEEDEDPESPSEPLFDPAMGMGVDESPIDGEYPDELMGSSVGSRYGSSSLDSSSRSRGSSKKGTPRIGGSAHLYGEDDGLDATPRRSHSMRRHRKLGHSRHSSESDGSASADEGLGAHRRPGRTAHVGLGLDGTTDHLTPTAARGSRSGSRTPSQTPLSPTPLGGGRHHKSRSGYSSPLRRDGSSTGGWRKAASPTFQPSSPTSHSRSRPSSRFRRRPSGGAHPRSLSSSGPRSDHDDDDSNNDSDSRSSSSSSSILLDEEEAAQQRRLYAPHLVHLASPLVLVSLSKRVEAGVYFAFARLVSLLRPPPSLAHQLSVFHSLFRRTLPDLKAYFEEEGLDVTPFVATWLQGLFAGGGMRLGEGGVLRLWDAYFARIRTEDSGGDDEHKRDAHHHQTATSSSSSSKPPPSPPLEAEQPGVNQRNQSNPSSASRSHHPSHDHHRQSLNPAFSDREPLSLHLYVCLSVLQHCKDTLEELDGSECESLLRNLPSQGLEVDKILSEAVNLRLGHRLAVEAAASAARPVLGRGREGSSGGVDEDGGGGDGDDDADKETDRLAWGLQPLFVDFDDQAGRSSGKEDDFSEDDDSTSEHSHSDHDQRHEDVEATASNVPSPTTLRHREALLSSLPGEGDLDPLLARHVWTAVKGAADREKRSRSKSHGSATKSGRHSSSSASASGREAIHDDDDDSDGRYEEDDGDDDEDDAEDESPVPQRPALVSSSSTGGSSMRRFSLEDDDAGGGAKGGH